MGVLAATALHRTQHVELDATSSCLKNLRMIQEAKQKWARKHRQGNDAEPTRDALAVYFPFATAVSVAPLVTCPALRMGATFDNCYEIGAVGELPRCKIRPAEHRLEAQR